MQGNSNLPQGDLEKHFGEGVLFVTYSLLISGSSKGSNSKEDMEGAAPAVTIKKGTRMYQIVQWLQNGEGDPLIVRLLPRLLALQWEMHDARMMQAPTCCTHSDADNMLSFCCACEGTCQHRLNPLFAGHLGWV